jgi:hypothetical protein
LEKRIGAATRPRVLFEARFESIMAGKVKQLIHTLIQQRTKGDPGLIPSTKIKLIMKGVDPDLFTDDSPDNNVIIQRIMNIAKEMGLQL